MGCDIHTAVEVGYDYGEDKTEWEMVDEAIFDNPYYSAERPIGLWNTPYINAPYRGRNYRLFSKLANVRNYGPGGLSALLGGMFGTADNLERDRIEPLAEPRGVPEDASTGWKRIVEEWDADMHSTSYFTLEELEKAREEGKFDETLVQCGWISLQQYIDLRQHGKEPDSWSGGVGGGSITKLTWDEAQDRSLYELEDMQKAADAANDDANKYFSSIYVGAHWRTRIAEETYSEFFKSLEQMRERLVTEHRQASHVRLVFGFDN